MNKHIYLFNTSSRAAIYGIGTYIEQLVTCLKNTHLKISVIESLSNTRFVQIEQKNNVRYIKVPIPNTTSFHKENSNHIDRYNKSLAILLCPYIRHDEKNIFHLNYLCDGILAECLKKYYGGKIVITVHYTDWSFRLLGNKKRMKRIISQENIATSDIEISILQKFRQEQKLLTTQCDQIVAISKHSHDDLIDLYKVNPCKVILINNAIKDVYRSRTQKEKQKIRSKYQIHEHTKIIVYAGRLDEIKGVNILIKAFRKVVSKYPDVRLFIIGDGVFGPLMSLAYPIYSRISFTGFLPKNKLFELYSIADIGVLPSIHEEFGYTAIEMLMYKIPLIVNKTTGLAEIIEHQICGLTTMIKWGSERNLLFSARELAENIIRLLENPELCRYLARNGRKRFLSHYESVIFESSMMNIYG